MVINLYVRLKGYIMNKEKLFAEALEHFLDYLKKQESEEIEEEREEEERDIPFYEEIFNSIQEDERNMPGIMEQRCSFKHSGFFYIALAIRNPDTCMAFFSRDLDKIYFYDNGLLSYDGKEVKAESMEDLASTLAKLNFSFCCIHS